MIKQITYPFVTRRATRCLPCSLLALPFPFFSNDDQTIPHSVNQSSFESSTTFHRFRLRLGFRVAGAVKFDAVGSTSIFMAAVAGKFTFEAGTTVACDIIVASAWKSIVWRVSVGSKKLVSSPVMTGICSTLSVAAG